MNTFFLLFDQEFVLFCVCGNIFKTDFLWHFGGAGNKKSAQGCGIRIHFQSVVELLMDFCF